MQLSLNMEQLLLCSYVPWRFRSRMVDHVHMVMIFSGVSLVALGSVEMDVIGHKMPNGGGRFRAAWTSLLWCSMAPRYLQRSINGWTGTRTMYI